MRLLVLGGTRFVGRSLVEAGVSRGWEVTALNRGRSGAPPAGVTVLQADRTQADAVTAVVGDQHWDVVVDTWSGPPRVVRDTAAELVGRAEAYVYVSSVSVYAWGEHRDETSPVVDGDPGASTDDDYAEAKRGAELGVLASFPGAVLLRAGLVLGPYEDVGRLPWWLTRIAAGGRVVAPGRPGRPLQYVDARDLADFALDTAARGDGGVYDTVSASGHTTTAGLLGACVEATGSDAELVWVGEQAVRDAGVQPWTQLPCWVPEHGDTAGFLESDTGRAAAAGLRCRPVADTVRDTWAWLRREGPPLPRPDGPAHGLPPDLERRLLGTVPQP